MAPIAGALNNKKLREAMKRHLRYARKKTQRSNMPLVSGDLVIARNTQYTTKTGRGKFETLGGGVREFTVLSVSQGFVTLKNNSTGALTSPACFSLLVISASPAYEARPCVRHEASLKLMPMQLEADDTVPTPPRLRTPDSVKRQRAPDFDPWIRVKAQADGAYLDRALHMGMQLRGGIAAEALLDRALF